MEEPRAAETEKTVVNVCPNGYEIDLGAFLRKLRAFYLSWETQRQSIWGGAEALAVATPPPIEDFRYLKSSALHVWLFGHEFQETIIVFMEKRIHILCSQNEACILDKLKDILIEPFAIDTFLHIRPKNSNASAQMNEVIESIKMTCTTNPPIVGWISQEIPDGLLLEKWSESLKNSGFQLVDVSVGFQELLSQKDSMETVHIRKAAQLSASVFNNFIIPKLQTVISNNQKLCHSSLMDETEEAVNNPDMANMELEIKDVDVCYAPIFQSGGAFDLRPSALSDDEYLCYDAGGVIICSIGARYKNYCSNISRSFIVQPDKVQEKAYMVLLDAQNAVIASLQPGKPLSRACRAAWKVVEAEGPEFIPHMVKSTGSGIGIEFRESGLNINLKNERLVEDGMVFNVSVGFHNLESDAKRKFSLLISDTVIVGKKGAENATGTCSRSILNCLHCFGSNKEEENNGKLDYDASSNDLIKSEAERDMAYEVISREHQGNFMKKEQGIVEDYTQDKDLKNGSSNKQENSHVQNQGFSEESYGRQKIDSAIQIGDCKVENIVSSDQESGNKDSHLHLTLPRPHNGGSLVHWVCPFYLHDSEALVSKINQDTVDVNLNENSAKKEPFIQRHQTGPIKRTREETCGQKHVSYSDHKRQRSDNLGCGKQENYLSKDLNRLKTKAQQMECYKGLHKTKNEQPTTECASDPFAAYFKTNEKLIAYKNIDEIPFSRELMIHIDHKNQSVLLPIYGQMVPFHISTIESISSTQCNGNSFLSIVFNVPTSGLNVHEVAYSKILNCVFLKEVSFCSKDMRHVNQVVQLVNGLKHQVCTKESEASVKSDLLIEEKLKSLKSKPACLQDLWIRPSSGIEGTLNGTLEGNLTGFCFFLSGQEGKIDLSYKNVKHAFFHPAKANNKAFIHLHLYKSIMIGNLKMRDIQFRSVTHDPASASSNGNDIVQASEGDEEERASRFKKNKVNSEFGQFIKKVSKIWQLPQSRDLHLEFDILDIENGFHGIPFTTCASIIPTRHCLVELTQMPFLAISVRDIEIVNLERVGQAKSTFDMVIIFKGFHRDAFHIDAIPIKALSRIRKWLDSTKLKYYENTKSINWKPILDIVRNDPEEFKQDGGWEFLNLEISDSDSEYSLDSDQSSELEESHMNVDNSDNASAVELDKCSGDKERTIHHASKTEVAMPDRYLPVESSDYKEDHFSIRNKSSVRPFSSEYKDLHEMPIKRQKVM